MNKEFIYSDLRKTLVRARACHEIWWLIEGIHPERELIIEGCNKHIEFFQTVRSSMFLSFIVSLSSIFDCDAKSIALKSLPEINREAEFSNLWERGRKLFRYRSKSIAHRDAKNNSEDFAKETGFTYDQLRTILEDAIEIYDRIAKRDDRTTIQSIDISPKSDFLEIMRKLSE